MSAPRPTWVGHAESVRYGATISPCGQYRYDLTREFDPKGEWVLWIGLNPSTADHREDDATMRRVIDFSHGFGFPNLIMCNLYALRSRDPRAIARSADPVGPDNDATIQHWARRVGLVLLAWGYSAKVGKRMLARAWTVRMLLRQEFRAMGAASETAPAVGHLGRTEGKEHQPRHPLYLPAATAWTRTDP